MQPLIAGNWKMHGMSADVLICPPATLISRGLLAIICAGETGAQRQAGLAFTACDDQIKNGVPEGITAVGNSIAYEPLWAIGTGHVPAVGGALIGGASLRAVDFEAILAVVPTHE